MISDLIVSIIIFLAIFSTSMIVFFVFSFSNCINVILNFFEIDMNIEFAMRTIFDLMIDSKHDIIDVELKLKLLANF